MLGNSFEANGKKWQYLPNNSDYFALFDGVATVSKSAMKLIGESGVKKIDTFFTEMRKAKEILYGENSARVGFFTYQYFAVIPENQFCRDLPNIFRTNDVIICDGGISNAYISSENVSDYDYIKRENFEGKDLEFNWKDKTSYRDYLIYTIEDTRIDPDIRWEWEKIKGNDIDTINKIKGTSFLSDFH